MHATSLKVIWVPPHPTDCIGSDRNADSLSDLAKAAASPDEAARTMTQQLMFVTMWGVFDPFSGSADDFAAVLDRVKARGASRLRAVARG